MASEVGLARLPQELLAASRVNPTCGDKSGHDVKKLVRFRTEALEDNVAPAPKTRPGEGALQWQK